ncbi:NUDIX hydrolase [Cellulomonas sp. RIT-PI-Y]|uniref:NUDIX hydrolase n=1 Tax=Cellulomonas sp. RIT-PI-Y TaxID=3035297 RepID=UPI0021D9C0A9|nr:NUDIX hydrolase [Cellulomonas sp. RIT-PI-Y]
MDVPRCAVTVDLVVLTIRSGRLHVLLVRRGEDPWCGRWALPGGFVRPDEDLHDAAERELAEETGVRQPAAHLEQLATYGDPRRDPRARVVSVAHLVLAPDLPEPAAGTDATEAAWVPVDEVDGLAFDHDRILADGLDRARAKLEYSPLAAAFCPPEFTVAELRAVYEAVWGRPLDPRNFHRKVTSVPDLLVDTGERRSEGRGRPAAVFRLGDATVILPPLSRD